MMIDRVGPIEPVLPGKKTSRTEKVMGDDKSDTISLSPHAMEKAEKYQVMELIKSAPELDEARIAELRAKINDPAYLDQRVLNATAENIVNAWFA